MSRLSFQFAVFAIGLFYIMEVSPAPVSSSKSTKSPGVQFSKPEDRLAQYGYIKGTPGKIGDVKPAELEESVSRLQYFGGLNVTGKFDSATLALLEADRCGMKDFEPGSRSFPDSGNPFARYNLQGTTWKKRDLTYKILNYTDDLPREDQSRIFRTAFDLWQAASSLTITDVTLDPIPNEQVDILISFSRRRHQDPYSFDGQGGTLAHAFYPHSNKGLAGDAHFDDDERFTTGTPEGINLDWVAVHEFGHSIGLEHSNVRESIMYPWYKGYKNSIQLTSDDIQGIQAMYGKRPAVVQTTEATTTAAAITRAITMKTVEPTETTATAAAITRAITMKTVEPLPTADECNVRSFDTFFDGLEGKTYAVAGVHYWLIKSPRAGKESGPYFLRNKFPGIQTPVDAAFSRNKTIIFFKGSKYWQYQYSSGRYLAIKSDRPMSDYNLTPEVYDMDAAFVYGRNNKIYFFKGNSYWKYDEINHQLYAGYPRQISRGWKGLFSPVDAVFTWQSNKASYYFKAADYTKTQSSGRHQVRRGYPQNIALRWMKCDVNGRGVEENEEP